MNTQDKGRPLLPAQDLVAVACHPVASTSGESLVTYWYCGEVPSLADHQWFSPMHIPTCRFQTQTYPQMVGHGSVNTTNKINMTVITFLIDNVIFKVNCQRNTVTLNSAPSEQGPTPQ